MTRPLRSRLTALAAALLFLLSGAGDVLGAHPCAHHDALAPGHAADATGAHHAHHAHDAGAPAPAEHDGAPCSCAGTCSAAAGVAMPRAPETTFAPPAVASAAPAYADHARLPGRLLPYLLPYAQAPPRAA